MGSCVYYAKWKFKSAKKAQEALPIVSKFLQEAQKAYDYWQSNRSASTEQFWATYKTLFPSCYAFMQSLGKAGGDCSNALSGVLSVGDFGMIDGEIDRLCVHGTEITYDAETWHMANWTMWVRYLHNNTGAIKSGWLSEEDAPSPSSMIELKA